MFTNRSFTQNRSTLVIVGFVAVLGLMALAVNFRGQGISTGSALGGPAASNLASPLSIEAYTARWQGIAQRYAPVQAYAARWTGLAETFVPSPAVQAYAARSAGLVELPSRAAVAYAARWTGLAETFAPEEAYAARWAGLAEAHRQRAIDAYAARWAGLAEAYADK